MSESDQTVIHLDGRNGDRDIESDKKYTTAAQKYRQSTQNTVSPPQSARDAISTDGSITTTRTQPVQLEVKLPWYKSVTWKDIRDILPTLIILFFGLLIMVLVIPYAFSSVIKQLQQEEEMKRLADEAERNKTLEAETKTL